jgi:hypothetical protein
VEGIIPEPGKYFKEKSGTRVNICGTEKPLGQGKVKIHTPEPENDFPGDVGRHISGTN